MSREVWIDQTVKQEHGLRCPRCGGGADGGTRMAFEEQTKPPEYRKGQFVICAYCAALLVFEKPLLRALDRKERRAFVRSLTREQREHFDLHMKFAQELANQRIRSVN